MSFFLSRSEQRFNRNLTSNRDPDATWIEERSGCHGNAPFRLANGARERKKKLSQKFFLFLPFNRSGCRVAPRAENDETRVEHDAKRHRRRRSAYRFPLVSSATRNSVDPPKKYQRKKKKKIPPSGFFLSRKTKTKHNKLGRPRKFYDASAMGPPTKKKEGNPPQHRGPNKHTHTNTERLVAYAHRPPPTVRCSRLEIKTVRPPPASLNSQPPPLAQQQRQQQQQQQQQ